MFLSNSTADGQNALFWISIDVIGSLLVITLKNFNSIRAISEQFVIGIVYFCIAHLVNALFGIKPVCSFCTKKIYIPSQTIYCGGCQLEFMIHKKDNSIQSIL